MATYTFDNTNGQNTLVSSTNNVLGVSCKFANLSLDDAISGGVWKFSEDYKADKTTLQGEVISTSDKSHSIIFDKYVSITPSNLAKYLDSTATDAKCEAKFGTTKINWWFNSQFPLIGVCRYQDNTLTSATDVNVSGVWSIGKLAYPVLGFTTTDDTNISFTQDSLNEASQLKMIDLDLGDDKFKLNWVDQAYSEVTVDKWLADVEKWLTIHNTSIFSEDYKESDEYVMNSSKTATTTVFHSILHTLTKNQITDLKSLFFTV